MPLVRFPERCFIAIDGDDAQHFLQNLVTTDIDTLPPGVAAPGALLTPQGKILFDFLVGRDDAQGFFLDARRDTADDLLKRLMLYKLRSKVQIAKRDQMVVCAFWENDSAASGNESSTIRLRDARFPAEAGVMRLYDESLDAPVDEAAWRALRIAHGVPEEGIDYRAGEAFPHDALLDQMGGVSFTKGCFVGQEVVSRMQHRGTARRRVLMARASAALPEPGAPVTAGGKPAGTLGSVDGTRGLAMVRIDRIKAAMDAGEPILAGDKPVSLEIAPWARFGFPQGSAGDGR